MKVLLVRPVSAPELMLNTVPPLGLGYLASALRAAGHEPLILDCAHLKIDHDRFRDRVLDARADVIAFSTFSNDIAHAREDMPWIKNRLPGTVIAAGGPHPSGAPESFFDHFPDADYGMRGEGESAFTQLISALESREPVCNIPGVIFRNSHETVCNLPYYEKNLDAISFPAWDLMRPERYPESPQGIFFRRFPIAPIITTRGCPCPCTFCAGRTVQGARVRRRSVENVIDEIQLLRRNHGIREIHILDENFTNSRNFALSFCESMIRGKSNMTWCCPNGVRLDSLDAELVNMMKRAGCYAISAGIESGSPEILEAMNKGITLEIVREKLAIIKDAGLVAAGFFILGFPGETGETIDETISFACELPLDRASFFNFLPLPGSPATRRLMDEGELTEPDFERLYYTHTPYVPRGLDAGRLKALQRRAFLKFFLRPRILIALLFSIRTPRQIGFIMKRMFAYLK